MMHALLGPSAVSRWKNCPPSARLALNYKDTGSTYAAEGTVAHALAEVRLAEVFRADGQAVFSHEGRPPVDSEFYGPEMEDYIAKYVLQVQERVNALTAPTILLEERVDLTEYIPESFGTSDVVIISDGVLEVIDLKYGKGVPVDADHNPQLMLYGLGALLKFGDIYDIDTVRVTIMQPRLDAVSTYELSADDLLTWAEEEIKPAAQLAWNGEGEFAAGDWCRFCPAKADCRARADANLELAKHEFADPPTLTIEEIAEILPKIDALCAWGNDVQDFAFQQALSGTEIPGYKIVEGRSKRAYTDEDAITAALQGAGMEQDEYQTIKLKGITELTKTLGKKRFEELLGEYIEKPAGKPVLVPESDKRPPLELKTSAADDFDTVDEEETE